MVRDDYSASNPVGTRTLARAALLAVTIFAFASALTGNAAAQFTPPNTVDPASGYGHVSGAAVPFDVGSRFMQRINAVSLFRTAANAANSPGGSGDEPTHERYRSWLEGYGLAARTGAQDSFPGDRRKTYGGILGLGAMVAPGVSFGVSVDQSRTKIDVAGFPQSGRIDLTQIGVNGAFERGPWALGATLIYGTGSIRSSRFDAGGESIASYRAQLWGALAELSYYWSLPGNARIVPKIGVDWMQARIGAFTETGGLGPVTGSAVTSSRVRLLAGAEIGKTWLANRILFDVAAYGRLVDNVVQDIGALQISLASGAGVSASIAGVRESTLGADAGAAVSARVSEYLRLYAIYDGRFRSNFTSHSGTLGAEVRW